MSDMVDDAPIDTAGEYVLGVLDRAERAAAAARIGAEPDFAAEVAAWEVRFAPLARLVAPVEPPAALWQRLSASVGAPAAATPPAIAPGAANDNLRRQLNRWRSATAISLALAAALAAVAFLPRGPAAPGPLTVAALSPLSGAGTAFLVRSLPDGRVQVAALAPAAVPTGRDLELWALPAGAKAPIALGVLPRAGRIIDASSVPAPGGKLLISLEPTGGSPTGAPTGPVLYGGVVTRL